MQQNVPGFFNISQNIGFSKTDNKKRENLSMGWKTRTFLGILLAVESSASDGEGDSALMDDKFSSIINQKNRDKVGIRPNKELIAMKYYHIIEETTDQQTVEVYAETMQEALDIYFHFSTNETATEVITTENQIVYDFPSETCTITKQNEQLLFIKWTHKKGLY